MEKDNIHLILTNLALRLAAVEELLIEKRVATDKEINDKINQMAEEANALLDKVEELRDLDELPPISSPKKKLDN